MSKTTTTAKMLSDGTVVEMLADGRERPFPPTPPRPMTEDELRKARRVPRVKTMRRALGITQEEFAARYHVPLGTLRDWEQGRAEPDQPAKAYLAVIAHDPEGVRRVLELPLSEVR